MASQTNKTVFRLHRKQLDYLYARDRFTGFVGGRGSGKTYAGAYRFFRQVKPNRFYLIAAPLYSSLSDVVIRTFEEVGGRMGRIRGKINKSKGSASAMIGTDAGGTAEVIFRSASDPDKFRGPNLSGVWFDEASYMRPTAFDVAMGCLREKGKAGWLSATFTPNGTRHWTYQVFGKEGLKDSSLVHATTWENPNLPADYADPMVARYSEDLRRQELFGEFVDKNLTLLSYSEIQAVMRPECGTSAMGQVRGPLYFGCDVGMTRNLTVLWTWELLDGRLWCRECLEMDNVPLAQQEAIILERLRHPMMARCAIDQGTVAAQMVQTIKGHLGKRILPVSFSRSQMGSMAMQLAGWIRLKRVFLPESHDIQRDFSLVENPTRENGRWSLSADQVKEDELGHHADRFWAAALGLFAYGDDATERVAPRVGLPTHIK